MSKNKGEDNVIAYVIHKYNIRKSDLFSPAKAHSELAFAKQELVYKLTKEQMYTRDEIATTLDLSRSSVHYLLCAFCKRTGKEVPSHDRQKEIMKLAFLLRENIDGNIKNIYSILMVAYNKGYKNGRSISRRSREQASVFPGVPRVPPSNLNAPVTLLEAPGPLLNEVEDG